MREQILAAADAKKGMHEAAVAQIDAGGFDEAFAHVCMPSRQAAQQEEVGEEVHVQNFNATILHLLGIHHERLSIGHQGLDVRLTGVEPAHLSKGMPDLESHPKLGASWEGFALHQVIQVSGMSHDRFFFWATQAGAEVDLFWQRNGKSYAAEFKYSDAPRRTKSMLAALQDLGLEHLRVVYPGTASYPLGERITVLPIGEIESIFSA